MPGRAPLYLRLGPEKDMHQLPSCLTVFAKDKAVYSIAP